MVTSSNTPALSQWCTRPSSPRLCWGEGERPNWQVGERMEGADFYAEHRYAPSSSHGDVADSSSARDSRYTFMFNDDCAERLVMLQASPQQQYGKGGPNSSDNRVGQRDVFGSRSELVTARRIQDREAWFLSCPDLGRNRRLAPPFSSGNDAAYRKALVEAGCHHKMHTCRSQKVTRSDRGPKVLVSSK